MLGTEAFPTTPGRLLARCCGGCERSVSSTRSVSKAPASWGAGLARYLTGQACEVIEVQRPNRQHRRRHGKSDPADAIGAARAVQSGEARGDPEAANGAVEAIRLLQVARRSAIKARTQAANQIHAVIDTAPDELRSARSAGHTEQLVAAARPVPPQRRVDAPHDAAKLTLRHLARRWQALNDEIAELDAHLDELTAAAAPTLVALNGVGTQTAVGAARRRRRQPRPAPTRQRRSPRCAARHRSTPRQADNNDTGSTAAATAKPTPRSTSSSSADSAGTTPPRTTWPDDSPKARPAKKSSAASSATSPDEVHRAITNDLDPPTPTDTPPSLLDIHRSIGSTNVGVESHPRGRLVR